MSDGNDDDATINATIDAYRRRITRETDIARGDLDEIEEHLRCLVDELRDRGMPAANAVTEAARRLGDPRAVAREHARSRPAFGAPLSGARTISVVLLLVPALAWLAWTVIPVVGVWSRAGAELAFGAILVGALCLRLTWARPILLGGMAFFALLSLVFVGTLPGSSWPWTLWYVGTIAFLMPWSRRELTPSAMALALNVWAYGAATLAHGFQVWSRDGIEIVPGAQLALVTAVLATTGAVLRARWAALAAAVSAVALATATTDVAGIGFGFGFEHAGLYRAACLALVGSGVVASAIGGVLAWRGARSGLGSLVHVVR